MNTETARPVLVWLRRDLRMADNPALHAAERLNVPVIPVYVLDDRRAGDWKMGPRSRWWAKRSLAALAEELEGLGSRLILSKGDAVAILTDMARKLDARSILTQALSEPWEQQAEEQLAETVSCDIKRLSGETIFPPAAITTKDGGRYKVYTPFASAAFRTPVPPFRKAPEILKAPGDWPPSRSLDDLFPGADEDALSRFWQPGEAGAEKQMKAFIEDALSDYSAHRDQPAGGGTSRLSPHLHFGEISPRKLWHRIAAGTGKGADKFLHELLWREFSHEALRTNPDIGEVPLREKYTAMPWRDDEDDFARWKAGETGIPFVDAGMRELARTGWMHNRVRMITATYLVKHLLLPWQWGERWFWQQLVDADFANNAASWQWVAGTGIDATPWFRIMNPAAQARRHDPEGDYIRQWVPELSSLKGDALYSPWQADEGRLAEAGVQPGKTYPEPLVTPRAGRERALAALKAIGND